jgi:YfiH family protein
MDTPLTPDAIEAEVLQHEAWKPIDWLIHGFSTRIGGSSTTYARATKCGELNLGFTAEDERGHVMENREALVSKLMEEPGTAAAPVKLVTLRQIHSKQVHRVGGKSSESPDTGDGLMTNEPGVLLAIQTADCVPVLIVDRERKAVAAFHAGWRGTVQRIVEDGIGSMRAEFGSDPEDLSAVIGPCIGACC